MAQSSAIMRTDSRLLQAFSESVLDFNPSILSSLSESQSAQRTRDAAWNQFLPTPSISADKADQPSRTALNQKTVIMRLQQPVWQGGRLTAALDQADAAARGSHFSWLSQAQFALEQLIQTISRHRQARHRTEHLERSVNTHERLIAQVRRRVREGLSPPSDLTVAESRLLNVSAERDAAQSEMRQQELQLQRLLSRKLESDEQRDLQHLPPPIFQVYPAALYSDDSSYVIAALQPRVLKLLTDREQIEHRIRILKANRLPQLSLRLDRIQGDVTGVDHVAVLSLNTTWGAGLSNEKEIEALQLRGEALDLDRIAELQEVQRRIASLEQDLQLQSQRYLQLEAAHARAETFLDSTERLYLTGRKAWLEVLNAAREVTASQTAASDALIQIWNNTQVLRLITHGPLRFAGIPVQQGEIQTGREENTADSSNHKTVEGNLHADQ